MNLGRICNVNPNLPSTGNGILCASGHYATFGEFSGAGTFAGSGRYYGYGTLIASGTISGNANTQSPLPVYSGRGGYYSNHISSYDTGTNQFYGYNDFFVTGSFQSQIVPTLYSGYGFVTGSGNFWFNGSFDVVGYECGTGSVTGTGLIVSRPVSNLCGGCLNSFISSGNFDVTGNFTGNGTYKSKSLNNSLIRGHGLFNLSGAFSGRSNKAYYGYGIFTGENIAYLSGGFSSTQPRSVYGIGNFNGTGTFRGENGFYSGIGTAKGTGHFEGYASTVGSLQQVLNVISGSGYFRGNGTIFMTNNGTITGIYCVSSTDTATLCQPFVNYKTDCINPNELDFDFSYFGDCLRT